MNNTAVISKIRNIKSIPGCDNINAGNVFESNIIVSKDIQENAVGIYFDDNVALSKEFLYNNNLYRNALLNKDTTKSGFFEETGRVRCLKLRGVKSDAFWISINSLEFTGYDIDKLKEGFEFTELNGIKICEKYISKKTRQQGSGKDKKNKFKIKISKLVFPEHFDTEQLDRNLDNIPDDTTVVITFKIHGTSFRFSNTKIDKKYNDNLIKLTNYINNLLDKKINKHFKKINLSINLTNYRYYLKKIFSIFGLKLDYSEYKDVVGSRRVIKTDNITNKSFYKTDIWTEATNCLRGKLYKSEMVYGEIVGYEQLGHDEKGNTIFSPLMGVYDLKKMDKVDKNFRKQYGDKMIFSYGCDGNNIQYKFFVYRISLLNLDGYEYDYSWEDVKRRCEELGVQHVPEIKVMNSHEFYNDKRKFMEYIETLLDKPSILDSSHIEEGVVIRIENGMNLKVYKKKGWLFKNIDGIVKDNENFVDLEESQSVENEELIEN